MTSSYYIYYRVDSRSVSRARDAIQSIVAQVHRHTNIRGRWLCKVDEPLLWMEVYEGVDDEKEFEAALEQAIIATAFQRFLQPGATRKIERFQACA